MKNSLSLALILYLLFQAAVCAADTAKPAEHVPAGEKVVAVIPFDSPPTYYYDQRTGRAAGFAVEVMNQIAVRAGFKVEYIYGRGWADVFEKLKNKEADVAPGAGISGERGEFLVFSSPIDAFPVSFFIRSHGTEIDLTGGRHNVGAIKGSVAYEQLKNHRNLQLSTYDSFQTGLFDLLAGKIDSFACPAHTASTGP
ncbi:MAG: transporter substrate-binding domain-containing protein [Nitrospinae bacterium]|nr:transporter substrate-binding domain-containing protein [Nitrospinota bacterium]